MDLNVCAGRAAGALWAAAARQQHTALMSCKGRPRAQGTHEGTAVHPPSCSRAFSPMAKWDVFCLIKYLTRLKEKAAPAAGNLMLLSAGSARNQHLKNELRVLLSASTPQHRPQALLTAWSQALHAGRGQSIAVRAAYPAQKQLLCPISVHIAFLTSNFTLCPLL